MLPNYRMRVEQALGSDSLDGLFGLIGNLANAHQTKLFMRAYLSAVENRLKEQRVNGSTDPKVSALYGIMLVAALYRLQRRDWIYRSWNKNLAEVFME